MDEHCNLILGLFFNFKECLGIIFQNENTTEGINGVLHHLHTYVPKWIPENNQHKAFYNEIGLVGDQLTIERTVNCILSMANGFTPDDRLEGMHAEIAD